MGGNSNRRGWPQEPTREERAETERRRDIARAAAGLAIELSGCVPGSDDHVDVTTRLVRFARMAEASVQRGQKHEASNDRLTVEDMPVHISKVIEQVMGRFVLRLRPDGRRGG